MASDPFVHEDFRVLTPEAFDFVLNNELKRAVRSQNFLTLLVVEPTPRDPERGEQVDDHNRDQQQAGSSAHGSSDSVSGTARW